MKFFLPAIALTNGFMFYHFHHLGGSPLYEENSLIENLQALFYAIAAIALIPAIIKAGGFQKFFLSSFALLCLTFFLREVDVEKLDVSPVLIALGSGIGRNIILTAGFLGLFIWYLKHHRIGFLKNLPPVTSPVFLFTMLAGILLFAGEACEKIDLVFWEETLELNASVLLLAAAIMSAYQPRPGRATSLTSRKTYAPKCGDTPPLP